MDEQLVEILQITTIYRFLRGNIPGAESTLINERQFISPKRRGWVWERRWSTRGTVDEVVDRLHEEYPDSTISLNYSNRLELLIAVMLSAQCTDERVNKVTAELFEKYDDAADYAAADQEELADDISSITYYNNKAKYIRSACADIIEKHDGEVPDTMSALTDLAGVGRKTANVVLQHGHDIVEGIVVDTHVQRLSRRLGLTEEERPERSSRT